MISADQSTVLMVVIPLLSAFAINIAGLFDKRYCQPLTVAAMGGTLWAALLTLQRVLAEGPVRYHLGGWPPPFGIEYVVDPLSGLVLVVIAAVSLMTALYAGRSVARELPEKIVQFYTLFVLLVTGLMGMTITGDAFNLFVLLEISALTAYGLLALGEDRALFSSFNYLIIGTIGASFYLLGVGHLYIMTGSLNMADIQLLLPPLFSTQAITVAFFILMVGVWLKMAFFPMHTWLPNVYTYAPSATSCLVAPLMTKVSVYIMIRIMFSIFTADYVFHTLAVGPVIVWMAVIAIVAGSLLALSQTDFKKMLTYLIVAEVGYMVGGVWLANGLGITGAILHIVNDALMTLCLFLAAGIVMFKTGGHQLADLQGLYRKMPLTMAAFTVGAFSMIGIPPTAGFFSKWYLILGGIEGGQYHFVAALLFSSLVNAILFFRVIEIAYFEPMAAGGHDHGHSHEAKAVAIDEAPVSMLLPLLLTAASLLVIGFYSGDIVTNIISKAVPPGL